MKHIAVIFFLLIQISCGGSSGEDVVVSDEESIETEVTEGETLWVSVDGDCRGNSPCYSQIIDALDASLQNYDADSPRIDNIYVYPGTYFTNHVYYSVIPAFHPFKLMSVEGAENTIITGFNEKPCADIQDPGYVLIQGFTFTECGEPSSSTVNDKSTIYSNSFYDMDLHIIDNVFENNKNAGSGDVIYISPYFGNFENINVRVERNVITRNHGGIKLDLNYSEVESESTSQFLIANNIIFNNFNHLNGKPCSAICLSWEATPNKDKVQVNIVNNTVVDNETGIRAFLASDAIHIENNIVIGNETGNVGQIWYGNTSNGYGTAIIRKNIIETSDNNTDYIRENNFFGSPLFYDRGVGDFRLLSGSDGIDIGSSNLRVRLEVDFLGNTRVYDGDFDGINEIDVGAIEYQ